MALTAVTREGSRRSVPDMHGPHVGAAIILLVTGDAIDGRAGPPVLARVTMAFRAVGKDVHPGEREAGHPMNLEWTGRPPAHRRVTPIARLRETSAVKVVVTADACSLDRPSCVVTAHT